MLASSPQRKTAHHFCRTGEAMTYFQELRSNWRPLLAAMIGLSCGFTAMAFTNSIMGPHLIHEFGWSKAQFALVGTLSIITLVALPVSGRLVDMFGVRRTACVGVVTGPITFVILSQMSGDLPFYLAILVLQNLLCMTTTSTVYSRTVVQHVVRARGLALALAASGPAITLATAGPIFNNFVGTHGWRAGYIVLAIYCFVGGGIALMLVPPGSKGPAKTVPVRKVATRDYGLLLRTPAFWIMLSGISLASLSQFVANSQLGILLLEKGVPAPELSGMISVFATGVLIGRFGCGIALDRFSASVVTTIVMALPAAGLFLIASNLGQPLVLKFAILLMGLSYGAESDVIGYLVARTFGIGVYGTVLGLMVASISLGSASGSLLLSITLKTTGGYDPFLIVSGVLALVGSLLFLLLPGRTPPRTQADIDTVPATVPANC
jgi:predicted MFS family arabinose efflux permease